MWDPDQLAEIPVITDRLQAAGDPLGEWLAIRGRLDRGSVARPGRKSLRRRARALREQLGPRLVLADDPRLGRPHAIRELGLIADVSFEEATVGRLEQLFARPDAPFVLRLRLRASAETLSACLEQLFAREQYSTSLRELALVPSRDSTEPQPLVVQRLHDWLTGRRGELGERLPSLFALEVSGDSLPLPFERAALDRDEPWTPRRRVALGRALASADPLDRRRALERLREHGVHAAQLRAPLLEIIQDEPDPKVRAAALAVVPQLGEVAHAILAVVADLAQSRDDPQLDDWLKRMRRI